MNNNYQALVDENGELRPLKPNERALIAEPGDRLLKKNSLDYLKEQEQKEKNQKWNLPDFVKSNAPELKAINKDLEFHELAVLSILGNYINYDGCLMVSSKKSMNFTAMVKITKIHKDTLRKTIKSLVNKKIMYQNSFGVGKDNIYYINPMLFHKGDRITDKQKEMFGDYYYRNKRKKMPKFQ